MKNNLYKLYFDKIKNCDTSHIKEVYLHVGMQKTATSSIQYSLKENTDTLKKQKYFT